MIFNCAISKDLLWKKQRALEKYRIGLRETNTCDRDE